MEKSLDSLDSLRIELHR